MRELTFTVAEQYEGTLLKNFLRRTCNVSSRLLIRLKKEPQAITVNGVPVTVLAPLHAGDQVALLLPKDQNYAEPQQIPLSVCYEDEDFLVLDKPPGMPVYPTPGHDRGTLANAVAGYCIQRGEHFRFRPLYRLDRNTSGIMVLAKHAYGAAALAGKIEKEYVAVCEGVLSGHETIDQPIGLVPGSKIKRAVCSNGEMAITEWNAVRSENGYTLLQLHLKTGRTHQIRVHMAWLGHPLAGDDLYGGNTSLIARQALHCKTVFFFHPVQKKAIVLQSSFPDDFQALLEHLMLVP